MTDKEKLEAWLLENHTEETVKAYLRDIHIFLNFISEEEALNASRGDILNYTEYLRKKYPNPKTITRILYGIKSWYAWLLHTGRRKDHPCRSLKLRDAEQKDIQLQDLLTPSELRMLLSGKAHYKAMHIKSKIILSLPIYQALRPDELVRLRVEDIDLEAGTIRVRGSVQTAGRTLPLYSDQIIFFYKYLYEIRPKLIKEKTDRLLIGQTGKPLSKDALSRYTEKIKHFIPNKKINVRTIRQSVIANLLKEGKDLRMVQAFAGHKKISTTERYRETGLEALKKALQKYHPLQ